MDSITRYVRNIRVETEILEALGWDEESLGHLNKYLAEAFQGTVPLKDISSYVSKNYGKNVWQIIERELKVELSYSEKIPES